VDVQSRPAWMSSTGRRPVDVQSRSPPERRNAPYRIYISDRLPRDDPAQTLGSLGRAGILIGRKVYILEIDTQIEPI
jgi:hypothetical protein